MEAVHAASMLPGLYLALANVAAGQGSFVKRGSCLGYVLCCFASMHFHLYKLYYPNWQLDDRLHKRALICDLLAQNLVIFFNCFLSDISYWGGAWILASSFLDIYLVKNRVRNIWWRHLNNSVLVAFISASNPLCVLYSGLALLYYVLGQRVYYPFHSAFHLFLHMAMNEVWKNSVRAFEWVAPEWADVVLVFGLIVMMRYIGSGYSKTWPYIERIIVSCVFACMNCLCFYFAFDSKKLFSGEVGSSWQSWQLRAEVGYYLSYTVIEMWNKDYAMISHHLIASGMLLGAYMFNYYHFMTAFLFIFTISNVPLAVAKAQKHIYGGGQIAFAVFAVMFFVFRICLVPWLIKCTLIDGWYAADCLPYMSMNSLILSLYGMQWYWFGKIVSILMKAKSKKE